MPRVELLCGLIASGVLLGCPAPPPAPEAAEVISPAPLAEQTASAVAGGPSQTAEGPPPERYATLPPGALDPAAADAGVSWPDDNAAVERDAAPAPQDPALVPNAGKLNLTGVRLGMNSAEVFGRYGGESGWEYNSRFVGESETGVVFARPKDDRARASEMFYLDSGQVVAFLRAVNEDGKAFNAARDSLVQQFGKAADSPPDWARNAGPLRNWRSTPNEQSAFWGDPQQRTVLTAGHSPNGTETVYMLLDVDGVERVYRTIQALGTEQPQEGDRSWNGGLPRPEPGS